MAIHAQKTTFRSSAQFPDFLVTGPLTAGQLLCYSEIERAFVNKDASSVITGGGSGGGGGGGGTIVGAVNLGTGAEWFKAINVSDELEFRTVLAGTGISIVEGADEIEITNDVLANSEISVPDSFKITIDNDDTTLDTAVFEICTYSNIASVVFTPISNTFAALDITTITDPGGTDPGQFVSATADFAALGYAVGMCISVAGTTEQDGIWKIASIDTTTNPNDTITITIHFPDDTDDGAQPSTTIDGMFFEFTAADTLVMFGIDVVAEGFLAGQGLDIIGSTDNDGTFTIATAIGDTLTITGTFPGTIGCDVGAITVEVPVSVHSTGWSVNELGEMTANATTICGDLDVICDGDINIDTGTLNLGGVDIITLINGSSLVVPSDGIVVQTGVGTFAGRSIDVTTGLTIVDADGIAGNPTISVDDFDITLSGDVTGTATVVDLTNTSITATLASVITPGIFDTVTVDAKGRVISGTPVPPSGTYQPASPNLDNLADGMTSPGYVVWDGSAYIDRIITGTTDEIVITEAAATGANTIIGLADNPVIPGASAMTIPKGFVGDYPATPVEGMMRYHMNSPNFFEGYTASGWEPFLMGTTSGFLPLTGGTMSGDIDMDSNDLLNPGQVDGRDVAADGIILDNINTGTGIKVQTAPDTFVNRTIAGVVPVVLTDGDGLAGNPTVEFDMTLVTDLEVGQPIDELLDEVLIYDDSQADLRTINPYRLNYHPARRYFMGQF